MKKETIKMILVYGVLFLVFVFGCVLLITIFGLNKPNPEGATNENTQMYNEVPTIAGQLKREVQLQIPTETPPVTLTPTPFVPPTLPM